MVGANPVQSLTCVTTLVLRLDRLVGSFAQMGTEALARENSLLPSGSVSGAGFEPGEPGPGWDAQAPGSPAKEATESLRDSEEMAISLTSCVWLRAMGGSSAPASGLHRSRCPPSPAATVGGGGRQASRAREAGVATTHRIKAPQPGPDHLRREPGTTCRDESP